MGKPDGERHPATLSEDPPRNAAAECRCSSCCCCCCSSRIRKVVGFRCMVVMVLSFAVFLSALFWLPPFLRLADRSNLHSDSTFKGHDVVASFIVNKSVSLLENNIMQLTDEIFDEIEAPSTKVVILSLYPLPGSNTTKVVFAVDPDGQYSEMSSAAISLIRSSFQTLVIRQSVLQLTPSLFGDAFNFEVLKFKGGITIIPEQSAFPLQTGQTFFSFSLNFSIDQIQSNFGELRSQLKDGLHLSPFENLYVILSNAEGSTVAAPTVVESSVLLAVGLPPSKKRLKQLAQTIMGPHNLGLNHTEFGKVKQVRLSSILQHSLHGGDGSGSPSPAPLPHPSHHHHHHHHQHHHHHDSPLTPATSSLPAPASAPTTYPVPALAPAPANSPKLAPATGEVATPPEVVSPRAARSVPAPGKSPQMQPPNCRFKYRRRSTHNAGTHAHLTPKPGPASAPAPAPSTVPRHHFPVSSPKAPVEPPAHVSHSVPALSPLPSVAFAHAEPPPRNEPTPERSHTESKGPSLSTSSASSLGAVKWAFIMFIVLVLHV